MQRFSASLIIQNLVRALEISADIRIGRKFDHAPRTFHGGLFIRNLYVLQINTTRTPSQKFGIIHSLCSRREHILHVQAVAHARHIVGIVLTFCGHVYIV